jgi:hypothetical protein
MEGGRLMKRPAAPDNKAAFLINSLLESIAVFISLNIDQ